MKLDVESGIVTELVVIDDVVGASTDDAESVFRVVRLVSPDVWVVQVLVVPFLVCAVVFT